jgi:hypothetical protein
MKQLTADCSHPELIDKVNELVIAINRGKVVGKSKQPMKEGSRPMYAILGVSGGIYGFASSSGQAKRIRDNIWNIGKRRPEKYLVTFKKI